MGLFSALKNLITAPGVRLASPDPHAVVVELDSLAVHPAEGLLIVVTSPAGAQVFKEIAHAAEPAQLRGPQTTVYISPTHKQELPVHDPKRGWVIPLSQAEQELLSQIECEPGDYELSPALAISIEGA